MNRRNFVKLTPEQRKCVRQAREEEEAVGPSKK